MNELVAFLIFLALAAMHHILADEPWSKIERRAMQVVVMLAQLGWMVERALECRPMIPEGGRYPILGKDSWVGGYALKDAWLNFSLSEWRMEMFRGDILVYDSTVKSSMFWSEFEELKDWPRYKVRVYYSLRHRATNEFAMRKAGMMGDDLEALLEIFAGCALSPADLVQIESVGGTQGVWKGEVHDAS